MRFIVILLTAIFLMGCGVQSIPKAKNQVDASFAEISNQYKRRADLVPNLVKTVKAYASHEQETLQAVVKARAKATGINVDPSKMNAQSLQAFNQAQGQLSGALSRLMVVVEKYPDLKASANFRDLSSQLEGTENRITIARQRYIESIKGFNDLVTVPPSSWTNSLFYKLDKMAQWEVENVKELEKAPNVDL